MKIFIEISREHYDSLLSRVAKESRTYSTLINSMIVRDSKSGTHSDTIMSVCEEDEARSLLRFAQQLSPEAALEIEEAIKLSRPA